MTLTDKQKKIAWIIIAVLVAIHFAPGMLSNLRQAWAGRNPPSHSGRPSPSPAPPAVRPPTVPPAPPSPDAAFTRLMGVWRGNAVMPNNGLCAVSLELTKSQDKPGSFTGFSSMSCGPALPLAAHQYTGKSLPPDLMRTLAPVSTILSGEAQNGELHLQMEKSITTNPDGCQPLSYVLTPFAEGLGATFDRGPCAGGQLVLRRAIR